MITVSPTFTRLFAVTSEKSVLFTTAPMLFVATDSGRTVSTLGDAPLVTVSATASDLVLLLHGRISPEGFCPSAD